MALVRSIVFVDGENLTLRYQALVAAGRRPRERVRHKQDVYVWSSPEVSWRPHINTDVLRVNYYTSMVGADNELELAESEIAALHYSGGAGDFYGACQLYPRMFKKLARGNKSRLVDINIAIDVMRHCYTNAVDVVYLFSGDGDFLSLVEEVARSGKKVCVGAFSSGLASRLKASVDRFFLLDDIYLEPVQAAPPQALEEPRAV